MLLEQHVESDCLQTRDDPARKHGLAHVFGSQQQGKRSPHGRQLGAENSLLHRPCRVAHCLVFHRYRHRHRPADGERRGRPDGGRGSDGDARQRRKRRSQQRGTYLLVEPDRGADRDSQFLKRRRSDLHRAAGSRRQQSHVLPYGDRLGQHGLFAGHRERRGSGGHQRPADGRCRGRPDGDRRHLGEARRRREQRPGATAARLLLGAPRRGETDFHKRQKPGLRRAEPCDRRHPCFFADGKRRRSGFRPGRHRDGHGVGGQRSADGARRGRPVGGRGPDGDARRQRQQRSRETVPGLLLETDRGAGRDSQLPKRRQADVYRPAIPAEHPADLLADGD